MSEYRIDKVRHRVSVTLDSGLCLDGSLFLQSTARFRPGPEDPLDALSFLSGELRPGDLFVTMGAGDNWKLGRALYEAGKAAAEARVKGRP